MPQYKHPGVYIEEQPGQQVISGAPTSVTGFVGRTMSGRIGEAVRITSWNAYMREFGGFGWGAATAFAVYSFFAEGGSIAYVLRLPDSGPLHATAQIDLLSVRAASAGEWGNDLAVEVVNYLGARAGKAADESVFSLNILGRVFDGAGADTLSRRLLADHVKRNRCTRRTVDGKTYCVLECYPGLSARDLIKGDGEDTRAAIERRINDRSLFVRVELPEDMKAERPGNTDGLQMLAGGAGENGMAGLEDGLRTLDAVADVNLLVAPDVALTGDVGQQRTAVRAVLDYCEGRDEQLFAVLDMPFGLSVQEARTYKEGGALAGAEAGCVLNSRQGAIYYPWLEVTEPQTGQPVMIPPSGAVAGRFAATDMNTGVWKAPAGTIDGSIRIATGLERAITDGEQDVLNPDNINAVRAFPQSGIVIWGARTMSSDPEWRYVPVRRVAMLIEQSLQRGLQWTVFEPNNAQLWGAVRHDVTAFLTTLWQQGALMGSTNREAFFVTCDASNNTQADQAQGRLNVDVGFAPLKPAEFVVVRIQLSTVASDEA